MKNTLEKLITKSFKRLLDKGIHRGFVTYEELGKSLGKREFNQPTLDLCVPDQTKVLNCPLIVFLRRKENPLMLLMTRISI